MEVLIFESKRAASAPMFSPCLESKLLCVVLQLWTFETLLSVSKSMWQAMQRLSPALVLFYFAPS